MEETTKIYLVGNNQGFLLMENGGLTQNENKALSFPTISEAMRMCILHNNEVENVDNFCKIIPYWGRKDEKKEKG